jgi:hypothetical protein
VNPVTWVSTVHSLSAYKHKSLHDPLRSKDAQAGPCCSCGPTRPVRLLETCSFTASVSDDESVVANNAGCSRPKRQKSASAVVHLSHPSYIDMPFVCLFFFFDENVCLFVNFTVEVKTESVCMSFTNSMLCMFRNFSFSFWPLCSY